METELDFPAFDGALATDILAATGREPDHAPLAAPPDAALRRFSDSGPGAGAERRQNRSWRV